MEKEGKEKFLGEQLTQLQSSLVDREDQLAPKRAIYEFVLHFRCSYNVVEEPDKFEGKKLLQGK